MIQERGLKDADARENLIELAFEHPDATRRLRGLWALQAAGMLDEDLLARGLKNDDPYVRAWTVQLACEDRHPSATTLATFEKLAERDPSPVVRLYLASAAGRLSPEARWNVVGQLARHAENAEDHNLPLLIWYAAEPLAAADAGALGHGARWSDSAGGGVHGAACRRARDARGPGAGR